LSKYGRDRLYVLNLIGPSAELRLVDLRDVREAESEARKAARFAGWQAKRLGYRISIEDGPNLAISITSVEGEQSLIAMEAAR
jgi:hypothetical protein